jgi:hypothetical protein
MMLYLFYVFLRSEQRFVFSSMLYALPRFSSLLPLVTEVTPLNQTCEG